MDRLNPTLAKMFHDEKSARYMKEAAEAQRVREADADVAPTKRRRASATRPTKTTPKRRAPARTGAKTRRTKAKPRSGATR